MSVQAGALINDLTLKLSRPGPSPDHTKRMLTLLTACLCCVRLQIVFALPAPSLTGRTSLGGSSMCNASLATARMSTWMQTCTLTRHVASAPLGFQMLTTHDAVRLPSAQHDGLSQGGRGWATGRHYEGLFARHGWNCGLDTNQRHMAWSTPHCPQLWL